MRFLYGVALSLCSVLSCFSSEGLIPSLEEIKIQKERVWGAVSNELNERKIELTKAEINGLRCDLTFQVLFNLDASKQPFDPLEKDIRDSLLSKVLEIQENKKSLLEIVEKNTNNVFEPLN